MASDPNDSPLLQLPTELIQHILSYVEPHDLAQAAQTCRHLQIQSYDDLLWQPIVNRSLPTPIPTPGPTKSFRDLYVAHHLHWFLVKHRIWIGDSEPGGKLLLARYNESTGSIEGNTVVATRGVPKASLWEKDPIVIVHSFEPRISLDTNRPAVKLDIDSSDADPPNDQPADRAYAAHSTYSKETLMGTVAESGLYSSLMLCRALPSSAITGSTYVWPPLRIPAPSRTRNVSQDGYNSVGHRPTRLSEVSHNNFRLRRWVEYTGRRTNPNFIFGSGGGMSATLGINMPYFAPGMESTVGGGMTIRMPEDITTYATLPESCYIPTPQKPWQGIWCGDYSGHGAEFLLITQPDARDESPLPRGTNWLRRWFRGNRRDSDSSNASFVSAVEHMDTDDESHSPEDVDTFEAPGPRLDGFRRPPVDTIVGDTQDYDDVPTGRLEAIKLTGDPNVPRGEYTFIAPDIGHGGFVRIADEELFRGARVVRSAGHIAGRGFTHDQYTPSQLIMVSHDTLAQFWQGFGHISYYKRVDLDALMECQ
ncbi:hypothetical protein M409DRAFT_59965 [Zasmidium cellare ATCC 36951]|uniref:F-box domain-containing protein n=1 Tax=Zasmidium cellare ATCC 36951 TaxID=1080233 RepID=A0A6A6C2S4_ZASCE|nr:uncharacterized protein M409DRAFT_59965 [Zasmidium cellare ATCC 36951]KAF2160490.1 hypothetical protein M409DRAFT_59965 [Zasmidium cellare ATCC 36951]